jgi:putative SOS response-associated peptidase YedK
LLKFGEMAPRIVAMCGRVIQSSEPLRLAIVDGLDVSDGRMQNVRPRYNAAPSQELFVIRQNSKTGERSLDLLKWGLIPNWSQDPKGGRKPINAKAEGVSMRPTFRDAYAYRRCIVPVDGFFEWRAIKGATAKQPYAIAMKDGSAFGLAGLWENWKNPSTDEWERTFAILTVPSNELVSQIHDRMPAILRRSDYDRWLSLEPNPPDLLITYPSEAMTVWAISTRVNKPENDDPSLLDRAEEPVDWQAPLDRKVR